jgi:multidrug resistance efflux pump
MAYEAAELELQNYINTKIQTVRLDIQANMQKLETTKLELQKLNEASSIESQQQGIENEKSYLQQKMQSLQQEIQLHDNFKQVTLEKFKTDKLVEINQSIKQQEEIIEELEDKVDAITVQLNNYRITSPINGIVNVHQVVNEGDIVHPGEPILTIIPASQSQYKMVLSVLNKDISKMKVGDKVKYHFLALPYKEYGALEGEITKISTDAIVNPEDGISYYTVEATIQNKPLYSYKGKKAHIKVGMQAQAMVVTDSKKILYYLLEKINLKD